MDSSRICPVFHATGFQRDSKRLSELTGAAVVHGKPDSSYDDFHLCSLHRSPSVAIRAEEEEASTHLDSRFSPLQPNCIHGVSRES